MNRSFVLVAALVPFAIACANPAKDKPKATVGEAVAVPAALAPGAVTYAITPQASEIAFTGAKVTGSHRGTFTRFKGSVEVPGGKMEAARIVVEIDASSMAVEPERLLGHLKSPDFLDVASFPKATFLSTAIAPAGGPDTYTVTGNLTLHGVTKSVAFPALVTLVDGGLKANATFSINRRDFGLVYPGMPDDLIRDEVVLELAIVAPKTT